MKLKQIIAVLLTVLLIGSALTACAGNTEKEPAGTSVNEETGTNGTESEEATGNDVLEDVQPEPQILTNIFREAASFVPSDDTYTLDSGYGIRKNGDGTLSLCASRWTLDSDTYEMKTLCSLLTFGLDGEETASEPLDLSDIEDFGRVRFDGDDLLGVSSYWDDDNGSQTALVRLSQDGTESSEELSALLVGEDGWFYVERYCTDRDGNIYILCDDTIYVLNPDFTPAGVIEQDDWVTALTVSPADGKAYIAGCMDDGYFVAPVERETLALGEAVPVPTRVHGLFIGETGEIYYEDDKGLHVLAADGSTSFVMDYQNSDVIADEIRIIAVLDSENVLAVEHDPETYADVLKRYTKAPDIDLADKTVITIAAADGFDPELLSAVVNFNRGHQDARIMALDYSDYASEENDWNPGSVLADDMANGVCRPDIVCDSLYNGSAILEYIVSNQLYADLNGFFEKDPDLDADDIIGCIRRTFSDKDGALWGIPARFSVSTLAGKTEKVGERTGWTFGEMLEFAKAVPEDENLIFGLEQGSVFNALLGSDGYRTFIDTENGTADFENELFVDYLNYVASLPEYFDMSELPDDYFDNEDLPYYEGKTLLKEITLFAETDWFALPSHFGTEDVTLVGYPSDNGIGGDVMTSDAFVITNTCSDTDIAWNFVKGLVSPNTDHVDQMNHYLPVFRSVLELICDRFEDFRFVYRSDGMDSFGPKEMMGEEEIEEGVTAVIRDYDESLKTGLIDYLDNCCGEPLTTRVPDELSSMVHDEIAAFLAEGRDAAETAHDIQAKAEAWLNEHK